MLLAIIKKVEGRWIFDIDSNHVIDDYDGEGSVFEDGAHCEIRIAEVLPLKKSQKDPGID